MEFISIEKSIAGRIFRGIAAIGRVLFGGPYRRRIIGGVTVTAAVAIYVVGVWGIERLLKDLLALVFGVPAPGQPLAPGTWLAPQNGLWPDLMAVSRVSMGVAGLLVLVLIARASLATDEAVRRRELKRVGRPVAMVASTWTAVPFVLHLSDQLAGAMAPTSDMLLSEFGATAAGGVILGLLTWVQPLVVAVGVLSTALLRAIILVGFVFWPVAWPLRALDHDFTQALGRSVTGMFVVAVTAKLLQAVCGFLFIYMVRMIESWWLRPIVFITGVILVFVIMPIVLLRYADRVMMLPGAVALSERQVGQAIEASADRVGQVHKRIESGRTRVNEWRTPTDSRDIFDTQFDDWRADASDDADASWFGGLDASFDTGWFEWSSSDERWWNGWIQRELIPSHSSVEWTYQQETPMDGSYGPDSEDPDEPTDTSGTQTSRSTRKESRWDNW